MAYNNEEKDMLLCYIADEWHNIHIEKELFIPCAGYIKDGRIEDHMYDSYIFLCQPNFLYAWNEQGAYLKPLTKADWLKYITDHEFAEGKNISALDEAVGEVKKAVNDGEYKANVFMTLFYPVKTAENFGEVCGKKLDFKNQEDRNLAMKWMVDESIRQFNEKNYQNIRLAGFYWFCEDLDYSDEGSKFITRFITDYIRSKGLKTCWCPYFYAAGYDQWKELGFDIAAHQANYFPLHHADWPNRGGRERLPLVAETVKKCGIGVGMEMGDAEQASAEIFKEYMKAGVEFGFMHAPHIYYMGRGPLTVSAMSKSDNPVLRSAYDELYKYIHRVLTSEDIQM